MENRNILDGNLATNKKRDLAILERNKLDVLRKLRIPRFAMFFWTLGFLSLGGFLGLYSVLPFAIIFLLCGLFIMKYPLISTIISVITGTIYLSYFTLVAGDFSFEPRDFVHILIYLILCVGIVNAVRLRKIDEEIERLSQ